MRSLLLATASAIGIFSVVSSSQAAGPEPAQTWPAHYGSHGLDLSARDTSIAPGDDFFAYANGGWFARTNVAPDEAEVGVALDLSRRAQANLNALVRYDAASSGGTKARQVGDLYNAFMNVARVEALGASPLEKDLDAISVIQVKAAFTELMGYSHAKFGKSLFWPIVTTDARNPKYTIPYIGQSGLGLPDRSYYFSDTFKDQRTAYMTYIERSLRSASYPNPTLSAASVLAFETKVAAVSWPLEQRRDVGNLTHPMSLAELQAYAPGLDWSVYLKSSGITVSRDLIVGENTAVRQIAALYANTPLETLKAWEAFHVVDDASYELSKPFVENRFGLRIALNGVQTLQPREQRAVKFVETTLGEEIGRQYVDQNFPHEVKTKAVEMVTNLKTAMAGRIERARWFSPTTRIEALKKLALLKVEVGYPSLWRDYSGLKIDQADLYGDAERSVAFERAYDLKDIDKPVDKTFWISTPQTVTAFSDMQDNRIAIAAAMLQPPIFDATADDAVNYGAAGVVIAHEITHAFDGSGRKLDGFGALRDWWTPEDARRFDAEGAKLAAQFDAYEGAPGLHINGKLTLNENIADLGGLLVALDAYHLSLKGKPAPIVDGLTGDQRFFLSWAQVWRIKYQGETQKRLIGSNEHSLPQFRIIGPLRNIDAWYAAFGVTGGKYYLKPEDRVRIW